MTDKIDLLDKTNNDLRVLDIAVEGSVTLLAEYVNDSVATGLSISFTRLKDDVEELINKI